MIRAYLLVFVVGFVDVLLNWIPVAGAATNRLLLENGDGLLLEDSSGDLALE